MIHVMSIKNNIIFSKLIFIEYVHSSYLSWNISENSSLLNMFSFLQASILLFGSLTLLAQFVAFIYAYNDSFIEILVISAKKQ